MRLFRRAGKGIIWTFAILSWLFGLAWLGIGTLFAVSGIKAAVEGDSWGAMFFLSASFVLLSLLAVTVFWDYLLPKPLPSNSRKDRERDSGGERWWGEEDEP